MREDVMLANIYGYSRKYEYDRALFFIGAGHRESMLKKIEEFNKQQRPKLNWLLL